MGGLGRGLCMTLRDADGTVIRAMSDPFGGTFNACGDFEDLLNRGASPLLDVVDPYGVTTLTSSRSVAASV